MTVIPPSPSVPSHTCRARFKPLPTSESTGVETPEGDMEEGRVLEMTPLTQTNSVHDDDDDDDQCLQPFRAASGRSPSRGGGGTLGFAGSDNEDHNNSDVRRGVNREGGRGGFMGDLENETNRRGFDEDGMAHVLESETTTSSAVWREFLVPIKLLQEKRVRAILFVYVLYSVRNMYLPYHMYGAIYAPSEFL